MKKLLPFILCSTAAALYLGAVSASAGYVTPRVPPAASKATAQVPTPHTIRPNGLRTVRIVTTVNDNGPGSLRQAIANAAPGDSINFALRLPATIIVSKTLVISKDLTVLGPGPEKLTVMRSGAPSTPSFRVFQVEDGAVTIAGVTIRNGSAYSGTNIHDNVGGGILNRGILTVRNCVIAGNSALTTDWGTSYDPSVSLGFGAGIFSDTGSELALFNSTISGNQASAAGGGICTFDTASFMAVGCTISGNFAELQGGGLNFQGRIGEMRNCTISGNATSDESPAAGGGSGILNVAILNQPPPTLTLTACTVARNTGTTNGGFTVAAFEHQLGITNRLLSTLVADNDGGNFLFYGDVTMQSLGHNLDSDGTSGLVNGVNGDLIGKLADPIDAKLGPLQDNGGPTLTMALLPGSPALGAAACSDANGAPLPVDQRGFPRPQSTGCDIGAFENQALVLISIKAVPNVLWPPNGKLVPVQVVVQAVSDSGPVTSRITSVRSNEPPSGREPDWVITGDLSLLLRAERSPHGDGRVYTITVESRDAAGNTSTGTVLVTVAHDNGGGPRH
jgi:hypothetical protein